MTDPTQLPEWNTTWEPNRDSNSSSPPKQHKDTLSFFNKLLAAIAICLFEFPQEEKKKVSGADPIKKKKKFPQEEGFIKICWLLTNLLFPFIIPIIISFSNMERLP